MKMNRTSAVLPARWYRCREKKSRGIDPNRIFNVVFACTWFEFELFCTCIKGDKVTSLDFQFPVTWYRVLSTPRLYASIRESACTTITVFGAT